MKTAGIIPLLLIFFLGQVTEVPALSIPIGRDINFPKGYDAQKAKAIRRVIQDERFKFVGGIVSEWPPDYGTRLSFEGNADSLNEFLAALRSLPGIGLRVLLYHGRNDEQRRDSVWQLDFSQARPDQLTVYLNLNAAGLDLDNVKLPKWPPHPQSPPADAVPQAPAGSAHAPSAPASGQPASDPAACVALASPSGHFAPVLLRDMQRPLRGNEAWIVQTVLLNPAEGNLANPGRWAAPAKLMQGNTWWK